MIEFTIPGRIAGKGRPRTVMIGGFPRILTPKKTRSAEAVVRTIAESAMRGRVPLEGPVKVVVSTWINRPASWSKKRKAATTYVTGKPDCDNVIKLLADSLNGIVYRDDAQISSLQFDRLYTDGQERVVVRVVSLLSAGDDIMDETAYTPALDYDAGLAVRA